MKPAILGHLSSKKLDNWLHMVLNSHTHMHECHIGVTLENQDTSVIRTLLVVPKTSTIYRFHYIPYIYTSHFRLFLVDFHVIFHFPSVMQYVENIGIPIFLMGVLSVCAGVLSLRLPETKGQPTPETLEELRSSSAV